ncbi:hypothetical protein DY000_02054116 [Brassica cretica]|uniref:Uncharacterized protein n=1 Tax=Brassica cretica TaxID=69181 RepID=A0ABQ7A809_BRACR|nr:hypothetical protein DY000_02054116 [Brassica cretica]
MSLGIDLTSRNMYQQTELRSELRRKSYCCCFLCKNKLKMLHCRDSSDQSQRKGEMVDLIKIFQSGILSSFFTTSLDLQPFWQIK